MLAIPPGTLRGVWTATAVVAPMLLPLACTPAPSVPAPPAPSAPAPAASSTPAPSSPRETGCTIDGPRNVVPAKVASVRLGMSLAEVRHVLGEPQYSPVEGQYYFFTGAECPLGGVGPMVPCGVVAEFQTDAQRKSTLQSCWWGAIGE